MNAALIAACATHPVNYEEPRVDGELSYFITNGSPDWYVSLNVRLYLHFEPCNYVKPMFYKDVYMHEVVRVDARTIAISKPHMLKASDVHKVDALDYLNIDLWEKEKIAVIQKYCDDVKKVYGVKAAPDSVDYSHQFCWSFDTEEEE